MSVKRRICDVCGKEFTPGEQEKSHNEVKMTRSIDVPILNRTKSKTTWWVTFKITHRNPEEEICRCCAIKKVKAAARKLHTTDIHDTPIGEG